MEFLRDYDFTDNDILEIVNSNHKAMIDYFVHNKDNVIQVINYFREIDKLHNIGHNIAFGVFGNLSDFDKKDKLQYIESLKKTISDDYEIEYETINGTYICVLKSKRKIKSLKKFL